MSSVQIAKARWYHDRIIDFMLASPVPPSQGDMAREMGYSDAWISVIVNSDAFKNRLEERKAEIVDPQLAATFNQRLEVAAFGILERLTKRIESPLPMSVKEMVDIGKLVIGDKNTRPPVPPVQAASNNLYVVAIPPPSENAQAWLSSAQGRGGTPELVEVLPGV